MVAALAVFAVSAVASASASAAGCYKVATAGTGTFEAQGVGVCAKAGGTKEYIEVEKLEKELKVGEWCAKVTKPTGIYSNNACTETKAGATEKEYIKVLTDPTEQQEFLNKNGKEVEKKGFVSEEGVSTLAVTGASVTCQKDTDAGKLVGLESADKVVVTFKECKGKKGTEECKVKSKGAAGSEEIVTNSLKGELGEVAAAEATKEVGLLLEGESSNVFVTLEGACLPVTPSAVEGSVVGEVTPLPLALMDNVEFLLNAGAQKIKTFERSFAKHCAPAIAAARPCEEDASFKAKLTAFTKEATFESKDKNEFEEKVEVKKGA
jgi:hypothetical protein